MLCQVLSEIRECEFRKSNDATECGRNHRESRQAQYRSLVSILSRGVSAQYPNGVGAPPRDNWLPYNETDPPHYVLALQKPRADIRARRIFARSTAQVLEGAPIEATPAT